MYDFLLVIETIVVLMLIGIILIQRSDSDGFGTGSGSGNQFMTGRASANLLTRTTAILATIFIVLSLILAKLSTGGSQSIADMVEQPLTTEQNAPLVGMEEGEFSTQPVATEQTPPVEAPAEAPKPE